MCVNVCKWGEMENPIQMKCVNIKQNHLGCLKTDIIPTSFF